MIYFFGLFPLCNPLCTKSMKYLYDTSGVVPYACIQLYHTIANFPGFQNSNPKKAIFWFNNRPNDCNKMKTKITGV